MSFHNKSVWMPRDAKCLAEEEMDYNKSSRVESKRNHQWLMDANEQEHFGNKKQALEATTSEPSSGISSLHVSVWEHTSSCPPASQFTDCLFGSGPVRNMSVIDRNISRTGNMNIGRKAFEDLFGSDSSVSLSMSHSMDESASCNNYGGIGKVRVNQARDSDNSMSASRGNTYNGADGSSNSMGASYDKGDGSTISLGLKYNNGDNDNVSMVPSFCKENGNLISIGHAFNKAYGDLMSINGHTYNKGMDNILSMAQPFEKADCNFMSMGQLYGKGDSNMIPLSNGYDKAPETCFSIGTVDDKDNEKFISMSGSAYNKVANNIISVGATYEKANENAVLLDSSIYDKTDSNILSMGRKGEGHTIFFGGFQDEPGTNCSGKSIDNCNYRLAMSQSSNLPLVALCDKDSVNSNADLAVSNTMTMASRTDSAPKSKDLKTSKKASTNNFPSNVKSLLSTGMLDGVPVKYVSWSREKNLSGVIKGTGYLCGCKDCKLSNVLNAYEFECHAGCKTKHPNNHIYFENGKTIYAVVQELKSTPQEILFDTIQKVTGSPINQKNFRLWKASYQAATRELQRIYGNNDLIMPA